MLFWNNTFCEKEKQFQQCSYKDVWKEAPNATGNSLTRAKNEDRTIFIFCELMSDMTRGTKKTGGSNKCYETGRLKHDTDRVEDRRNKPSDEKEKQYQQNNKIKTGTRNSVK